MISLNRLKKKLAEQRAKRAAVGQDIAGAVERTAHAATSKKGKSAYKAKGGGKKTKKRKPRQKGKKTYKTKADPKFKKAELDSDPLGDKKMQSARKKAKEEFEAWKRNKK